MPATAGFRLPNVSANNDAVTVPSAAFGPIARRQNSVLALKYPEFFENTVLDHFSNSPQTGSLYAWVTQIDAHGVS